MRSPAHVHATRVHGATRLGWYGMICAPSRASPHASFPAPCTVCTPVPARAKYSLLSARATFLIYVCVQTPCQGTDLAQDKIKYIDGVDSLTSEDRKGLQKRAVRRVQEGRTCPREWNEVLEDGKLGPEASPKLFKDLDEDCRDSKGRGGILRQEDVRQEVAVGAAPPLLGCNIASRSPHATPCAPCPCGRAPRQAEL